MSLKEEIVELIKNSVFMSEQKNDFREPIVGFSSANNPLYIKLKEIVGAHVLGPKEILPEASTVVSFFIPFSEEIVKSNLEKTTPSREWAKSYVDVNFLINQTSEHLIDFLNKKGVKAATIKSTHTFDEETLKSAWSHRSAAFIAGMGKFGVNRMIITEKGCAGRFGTVIISEEIPSDSEVTETKNSEYCLYHKNSSCLKCIKSCPVEALQVNGFDKFVCYDRLLENVEEHKDLGLCDVCGKCVVSCPLSFIDK